FYYTIFFCLILFYLTDLLSFPTRRSSDLESNFLRLLFEAVVSLVFYKITELLGLVCIVGKLGAVHHAHVLEGAYLCFDFRTPERSEEHTSELQSRSDLVCRLLLEKKKKII